MTAQQKPAEPASTASARPAGDDIKPKPVEKAEPKAAKKESSLDLVAVKAILVGDRNVKPGEQYTAPDKAFYDRAVRIGAARAPESGS